MNEITIVTAFFDIARGQWSQFNRSNKNYFDYFRHWARIQNKLIVYTEPKYADEVMEIRRSFGLEQQTRVIAIPEVEQIDAEIFQRIEKAMHNQHAWVFRKHLNNPESWNAKYNYIMLLKSHFINDAIQKRLASGTIAWVDFGFDHGGENFPNTEEFDFLWTHAFSPHIHIFAEKALDDLPIFEVVRSMNVYVKGNVIIANDALWPEFWKLCRSAMQSLTASGMADDDQTLMLMAYRERPELFELHESRYWGSALKENGGAHLSLKLPEPDRPAGVGKKVKAYLKAKYARYDIKRRNGERLYKELFSKE